MGTTAEAGEADRPDKTARRMGLRAPDILEKSLLENSDRNLSAAKKAIERLAEARGQDAPSSDPPPNPYILASTHQASQEKAEADKRKAFE